MTFNILDDAPQSVTSAIADKMALILRIGLASVFIVGGWWKLSRAIDLAQAAALVDKYTATDGYINAFFMNYLFADGGGFLTPLLFLTLLSAFELLAGISLLVGLLVRPISFIFAFMMWTFVIALPVVTAGPADGGLATHYSPALLVQIRDVGLSGMFFCMLALGSGSFSLDQKLFGRGAAPDLVNMDNLGLLLRLSVAATFLVGGFFAGYGHIKSFVDVPFLLIAVGAALASGYTMRIAAGLAAVIITYYCFGKIDGSASLVDNANGIKRELAFLTASIVLFFWQGGRAYRPARLFLSPFENLIGPKRM